MGYDTDFNGTFTLDKPLTEAHAEYLRKFAETRRMKRNADMTATRPDLVREAVGLPVGPEGAYFVGEGGMSGQDRGPDVVEYNHPPTGQPGLWCEWVPTESNMGIEWDGIEKFYDYVEGSWLQAWIEYLIEHFLRPWGYTLNGSVQWRGEEWEDTGTIVICNNEVRT